MIDWTAWVRLYRRDVPRVFALRVGDGVIEGALLPRKMCLRVTGTTANYETLAAVRKVIQEMQRHVGEEYRRAGRGVGESLAIRERVLRRWDDEVQRRMGLR